MSIELFSGKIGYITKIGTKMLDTDAKAIMACLRDNADVFAFSSTDLIEVDTQVAMHYLNVDLTAKLVKQKLR